ncbi:MAG: diacylglycerol kinase [Acidobacteria bacterium]|nr:diacylglycerol kinase [Acidobacteriota bacterium]
MSSPRSLLIFNPNGGRGRTAALAPSVEAALRDAGMAFDTVATAGPGDATRLAASAPGRYDSVVSLGGDGTVHEIVNGLLRASAGGPTLPLAVVPLGSGDDFAKMIPPEAAVGGRAYGWREAVSKIARREIRPFDVGRVLIHPAPDGAGGVRYFVNNLDVGFAAVGAVNARTIPRFLKGTAAYLATAIRTVRRYPDLTLLMTFDGEPPVERRTTMTAVMNGRCLGAGFWVCPDARADDGLFDVMVIERLSRLAVLRTIPKIMRGTHVHETTVRTRRTRRVVLESPVPFVVTADGELPSLEALSVEANILPGKLSVMI